MSYQRPKCPGCGRTFERILTRGQEQQVGRLPVVGVAVCSRRCQLVVEHKEELERRAAR